ncbi:hypothetical protein [Cohnella laeviribosi]|uniref:hypothetical protein n=1 Tax=Cohnella laeviribosi TaxID=380174 RepID=UPI00037050B6|nr:hypothetical protein [Cohnella laeviribosi]
MIRKRNQSRLLLGVTAVLLGACPIYTNAAITPVAAAATSNITSVAQVVKPIFITSKSYFNLVDVGLTPDDDGQTATFMISIYNGDSKELDLTDYWFRVSSASGSTYPIKTSMADAKTTKVAPYSKVFITLYAKVGEKTKLSDLTLRVVKFDFSSATYEKTIGRFAFPTNYTSEVTVGSIKPLYNTSTVLYSRISSASIGASGDYNLATVNFVYNNVGKKSITLSGYKYYIVTAAGQMYPATSAESGDLSLNPAERKEIQLTASIPNSIKTTGWKLVVVRDNGGETGIELSVGTYKLNFSNSTSTTAKDFFTYSNSVGTYQFTLLQLQREPWDNEDVLSGRVRIQNKSASSIEIPEITGYFYFDDKVKMNFNVIKPISQNVLNAGGYVDIDVYVKLPTNYSFTSVKAIINNKVDDKTETKLGELKFSTGLSQIPLYAADKTYNLTRDGKNMAASLNAVNVYHNTTSKILSVQMTLANMEQRTIDPIKLSGLFINDNNQVFPATLTMIDGKVNPSNKALITFTATLPQSYDTSNLRLIIGEAVAESVYASGTTVPDAYVNAVKFNLPAEQKTLSVFKNVPLLPYQFTINKFTPTILGDDVQVTLDYNLIKDTSYNLYPTDRKLVLSIDGIDPNDGNTYTYFTQELTVEGDSSANLVAGTNNKLVLKYANGFNGIDATLNYKVRLYEVVQSSKKLLVERPLGYWFVENDWTSDVVENN